MKTSRFSETQIIAALRRQETSEKVRDIWRNLAISEPTFYAWKDKYGGMSASELKRVKDIETENAWLKRMYADLSLVHDALKEAVSLQGASLHTSGRRSHPVNPPHIAMPSSLRFTACKFVAGLVMLAGCDAGTDASAPVPFETLARSSSLFAGYAQTNDAQTSVAPVSVGLISPEDEARFLASYPRSRFFTGDDQEILAPFPEIDYGKQTSAVIALGTTGSSSISVRVDSVVANERAAVVYATKVVPCILSRDFANPAVVIAIEGPRRNVSFAPLGTEQSTCL